MADHKSIQINDYQLLQLLTEILLSYWTKYKIDEPPSDTLIVLNFINKKDCFG